MRSMQATGFSSATEGLLLGFDPTRGRDRGLVSSQFDGDSVERAHTRSLTLNPVGSKRAALDEQRYDGVRGGAGAGSE